MKLVYKIAVGIAESISDLGMKVSFHIPIVHAVGKKLREQRQGQEPFLDFDQLPLKKTLMSHCSAYESINYFFYFSSVFFFLICA